MIKCEYICSSEFHNVKFFYADENLSTKSTCKSQLICFRDKLHKACVLIKLPWWKGSIHQKLQIFYPFLIFE